ncbi:MAG: hypothetical protein JRN19_05440 [Nitrososphaerota archaeon]|nr:hypothetical protein [Nitrososphaerota archaeon]MDG7048930.1 hypothetical protein [Nitrososphaerota archaeon]MDG7051877.1 hypothetical protein [Nitrososphaerota archaeon]
MSTLMKRLRLEDKRFITSSELKSYCASMKLDYDTTVRYFESRREIIRIFRGVFYVRSLDEVKLGRAGRNHLELVARGLQIKGVKKWYFGLHTALKLNNMTHEHYTVDEVVTDSLFRAKPMTISGHKFRFIKLSPALFDFGIIEKDGLRFSDPEKTILDFIYVWRYNGIPEERIVGDLSDWTGIVSWATMARYARKYPATVLKTVKEASE